MQQQISESPEFKDLLKINQSKTKDLSKEYENKTKKLKRKIKSFFL